MKAVLAFLILLIAVAIADTTYVTIGSPFRQNAVPFWGQAYDAMRVQLLYLQREINHSGRIVAFGLNSCGDPPGEFYNVRAILCHTPVATLGPQFGDNYGGNTPVEVFVRETLLVNTGPNGNWYEFPVAFDYNNTDNLLFEIAWRGDNGQTVALWRNSNGENRRCIAYDDTAKTGTPDNVNAYYARIALIPMGLETPNTQPPRAGNLRVLSPICRPPLRFICPTVLTGIAKILTPDGRCVATLPVMGGEATWNAAGAAAGVYLIRLGSETATFILLR